MYGGGERGRRWSSRRNPNEAAALPTTCPTHTERERNASPSPLVASARYRFIFYSDVSYFLLLLALTAALRRRRLGSHGRRADVRCHRAAALTMARHRRLLTLALLADGVGAILLRGRRLRGHQRRLRQRLAARGLVAGSVTVPPA